MQTKCDSLKVGAAKHATLRGLVDADKKAGIVTQKNSCGRNLHRLNSVLAFMRLLLAKLMESDKTTPKARLG
jgi:hypothetical protein